MRVTISVPATASASAGHASPRDRSRIRVGSCRPIRLNTTLSSRKITVPVDRVQLQPGLRGGDPLPPPADDQARDDHRRHRRHVQRLAQHERRIRGDQREHGLQHRIGDPAAHRDDPGREHAAHRRAAGRQDRELPGAVQQHAAGRGRPAVPATAKETAIWNSTRLVASLNRLSACTSACTFGGSESRRPSALTATGSVLASTAPSTNAMLAGTAATAHGHGRDRGRRRQHQADRQDGTGRHTARRSRHGSSSLAAYNSGGSTTRLTTSGGTWTAGNRGSRATTSPAITSRDGAGTRSRPAKAATTVPSTTRNKMVSTPRTSLTSPARSSR